MQSSFRAFNFLQVSRFVGIDVNYALHHVGQTVTGGERVRRRHHVLRLDQGPPLPLGGPLPEQIIARCLCFICDRRGAFFFLRFSRTRTLAPFRWFGVVFTIAEKRAHDVHRDGEDDGRVLLVTDGAQCLKN